MSRSDAELLGDFRRILKQGTWKIEPKCEIQVHHDREGCLCKKPFYKVESIKSWLNTKCDSDPKSRSNVKRLIQTLKPHWAPAAQPETDSLLVFACLARLGYGDLIHVFAHEHVTDDQMLQASEGLREKLYEPLIDIKKKHPSGTKEPGSIEREVETIISEFEEERWAFKPAGLEDILISKSHDGEFEQDRRLPFCAIRSLGKQGSTAGVFEVLVPEELVPENFRIAGRSLDVKKFGMCHCFVLKVYDKMKRNSDFDREISILRSLKGKPHIIRAFGYFTHRDPLERNLKTRNILLEYGESDLSEYYETAVPPQNAGEIIRVYKNIALALGHGIESFHNFKYGERNISGCHGDLKPANFVQVKGQWKVADFGYANIVEQEESQQIDIKGGSLTYGIITYTIRVNDGGADDELGAPETNCAKSTNQKIDTWSFGCVLSEMVTWVVGGVSAVNGYTQFREKLSSSDHNKHRDAPSDISDDRHTPDAFHNGSLAYPELKEWHEWLKSIMRKSDDISPKILTLIENKLLCGDPKNRSSFPEICCELGKIIEVAEREAKKRQDGREVSFEQVFGALAQASTRTSRQTRMTRNPEIRMGGTVRSEHSGTPFASRDELRTPAASVAYRLESIGSAPSDTVHKPANQEEDLDVGSIIEVTHLGARTTPTNVVPSVASSSSRPTRSAVTTDSADPDGASSEIGSVKTSITSNNENVADQIQVEDQSRGHPVVIQVREPIRNQSIESSSIQPENGGLVPTPSHGSKIQIEIDLKELVEGQETELSRSYLKTALSKNPALAMETNERGDTLMMIAISRYKPGFVQLLAPHSDVKREFRDGKKTVLHLLIEAHIGHIQRLHREHHNNKPLLAPELEKASMGLHKAMDEILRASGEQRVDLINAKDRNGESILYKCVNLSVSLMYATVVYLVDHKAPIDKDIFNMAVGHDLVEEVGYFVEKGAEYDAATIRKEIRVESDEMDKILRKRR